MKKNRVNDSYFIPMSCPKCLRIAGFRLKVTGYTDEMERTYSNATLTCRICGHSWKLEREATDETN